MDVDFYKENAKSKNTLRSKNCWIKKYQEWAKENNFPSDIELITDANSMNKMLEKFFCEVKKIMVKSMILFHCLLCNQVFIGPVWSTKITPTSKILQLIPQTTIILKPLRVLKVPFES